MTWAASTVVRLALGEMIELKSSIGNVFIIIYIISMLIKPLETKFCMLYFPFYIIKTLLAFFSIQHSKTECTVRGFRHSPDYRSVQGVHHTIVAVWLLLQLLLNEMKLAMVFISPRASLTTVLAAQVFFSLLLVLELLQCISRHWSHKNAQISQWPTVSHKTPINHQIVTS